MALIYDLVTDVRNLLYDKQWLKSARFELPVISVGNLSVGGTGKTPHIEYLIRLLQYEYKVGTLSRGYGRSSHGYQLADQTATAASVGDEPMIFHIKYPDTAVAVAEDRVIGIPRMLQDAPDIDVILLDDAYQHRSVVPGLSVLLTEYDKPFTRDHVLPLGWLRESAKNYERSDIIIVTKCPDDLSEAGMQEMRDETKPKSYQRLYFSTIRYSDPYPLFREMAADIPRSADKPDILLVSGIADNQKLVKYLEGKGNRVFTRAYKDHHNYDEYDLEAIRDTYHNIESAHKIIVTTEKDAVRLWLHRAWFLQNKIPIFVQPIAVHFLHDDQERFDQSVRLFVTHTRQKLFQNNNQNNQE